jgi:CubicO group peptidase (beta-lactamase class C family)
MALRAGKDYETLLKERVLEPLGMNSTAITVTRAMAARVTPGHTSYLQPIDVWEMKTLQASGSVRSTANDMLRFLGAYFGEARTPLAESMALQLRTRAPNDATTSLGWGSLKVGERELFLWEGGKSGYRSAVVFDPRMRTGVVVLQNARTDDRPTALALHLVAGRPLSPAPSAPAPKPVKQVSAKVLDRYVGNYRTKDGTARVIHKGDHLLVSYRAGDEGIEFLPTGERDFFSRTGNDDVTFESDAGGVISGMRIYGEGKAAGQSELAPRL